jgi:hypothetical protein
MPTFAFASQKEDDLKLFESVSRQLMSNDIQTVVVEDENPNGPCLPDGASYMVNLQYRQIYWDNILERNVYRWITIKTVNVNRKTGEIIQICKW